MELYLFTDEQIRNEWRRRLAEQNHKKWYYISDDDDDPEWCSSRPIFRIVNRRTYHLQHKLQETQINIFLKFFPKKFFREQGASYFEFSPPGKPKNPIKVGEKLLQKYGFQKLTDPYFNSTIIHDLPNIGRNGRTYRATWFPDTPELKDTLLKWIQSEGSFASTDVKFYRNATQHFANNADCVAFWFNTQNGHGTNIALMKKDVFASLPPKIYERDGNWE